MHHIATRYTQIKGNKNIATRHSICYRTYARIHTHIHTLTHTHTHPHIHILYMLFLYTVFSWLFLHTLSDSNLAEWQLLALFLPDFTCLFNKLFSFSVFQFLYSSLLSSVLFSLFTHSAFCSCIRSATKVLKQFLSQDFVSSNCLLFASNLQQVHIPLTALATRVPLWPRLATPKSFLCANCSWRRTAYDVGAHHKCHGRSWLTLGGGGRGMQTGWRSCKLWKVALAPCL